MMQVARGTLVLSPESADCLELTWHKARGAFANIRSCGD
jgi:hypothetical protein